MLFAGCLIFLAALGTSRLEEFGFEILPEKNRNAIAQKSFLWPDGKIQFTFHRNYTAADKASIYEAMRAIEDNTCVEFVESSATPDEHHVEFIKSSKGCGSHVGYHKNESQLVALTDVCISKRAAIQHELLHVCGLFHQQCREDRDEYLEIIWENIDTTQLHNFHKISEEYSTTFGLPFDYQSLMQYPRNAYSKDGKLFTMLSKLNKSMELGQSDLAKAFPTPTDFEMVNRMYECQARTPTDSAI